MGYWLFYWALGLSSKAAFEAACWLLGIIFRAPPLAPLGLLGRHHGVLAGLLTIAKYTYYSVPNDYYRLGGTWSPRELIGVKLLS